jgi:hypothetical protein
MLAYSIEYMVKSMQGYKDAYRALATEYRAFAVEATIKQIFSMFDLVKNGGTIGRKEMDIIEALHKKNLENQKQNWLR